MNKDILRKYIKEAFELGQKAKLNIGYTETDLELIEDIVDDLESELEAENEQRS